MLLVTELFFILASALLASNALTGSLKAWRLQSHPIDFAMRILACTWLLFLLVATLDELAASWLTAPVAPPAYLIDVARACLFASLAFFLLTAAGAVRPWVLALLALQLIASLVITAWLNWSHLRSDEVRMLLMVLTLASAASVTGVVMHQVRRTHSRRSWLVLAACAMGMGLWLHQATATALPHGALPVVYHVYAFFIFVIWKLVSLSADADKTLAHAGTSFGVQSNLQTYASIKSDDDFISLALRGERQRISYELHDNVGSQIVSILFAMQAADQPQKRFVMLALEQCLSDLKMVVDALDSFDENVTQALGRLRYRVQHALDRQGIAMRWEVDISPELEAVQGIYAQQVLRIAQESMANVMRHARASSVRVTCRFVPEFCQLLLEVKDNGMGIVPNSDNRLSGRGLESMKRRAAAVGGVLQIACSHEGGTCVRLTLPLPHLKVPEKTVVVKEHVLRQPMGVS